MQMVFVILITWGVMGYVLVSEDMFDRSPSHLNTLIAAQ
jgi:hypothetical protein